MSIVGVRPVLLNRMILMLSGGGGTTIVVVSNDLLTIRLALLAIAASVVLTMLNPLPKPVRWILGFIAVTLIAAFAFWPSIQTTAPILAQGIETILLSSWGLFEVFVMLMLFLYFSPAIPKLQRRPRSRVFPILVETNTQAWGNPPQRKLINITNK